MTIDKELIKRLFDEAAAGPRLRMNYDLRDSELDGSQRMLNALLPGTEVPIHRHPNSSESVVIICGSVVEVFYDDNGQETERIPLCQVRGSFGCQIPKGTWHSLEVLEPSVIIEVKEGRYGSDGSERLDSPHCGGFLGCVPQDKNSASAEPSVQDDSQGRVMAMVSDAGYSFRNSLGDLSENIEYLIGMERHSGSMEVIMPLYVSRMLNVPLAEVEAAMGEMEL